MVSCFEIHNSFFLSLRKIKKQMLQCKPASKKIKLLWNACMRMRFSLIIFQAYLYYDVYNIYKQMWLLSKYKEKSQQNLDLALNINLSLKHSLSSETFCR